MGGANEEGGGVSQGDDTLALAYNNTKQRRGIIPYLEYQSVCPFVRTGSPAPSPVSKYVPSVGTKGGGGMNTSWRVRGRGSQFGLLERKPDTLSILCITTNLAVLQLP